MGIGHFAREFPIYGVLVSRFVIDPRRYLNQLRTNIAVAPVGQIQR
jgi:hypothetical protein